MRHYRRRLLIAGVLLLAAAVGAAAWWGGVFADWLAPELSRAADAPADAGRLVVGRTVHVSAARPAAPHYGCTVAADPTRPDRLFAASNPRLGTGELAVVGYHSQDGGETWALGCERAGRSPDERCCDEAVAFGPDGDLVLAHMRGDYGQAAGWARARVDVLASADCGRTWAERGFLAGPVDRPQLAFDLTDGPHRGRLYCNANVVRPPSGPVADGTVVGKAAAAVYASGDGGGTLTPAGLPDPDLWTNSGDSNPVVLPGGAVVAAYAVDAPPARDPHRIVVWRSAGGRSPRRAGCRRGGVTRRTRPKGSCARTARGWLPPRPGLPRRAGCTASGTTGRSSYSPPRTTAAAPGPRRRS